MLQRSAKWSGRAEDTMRRGMTAAVLLVTAACSSVPGSVCVAGATYACTCSTGGAGVQSCNAGGTGYDPCTCIAADAARSDAGTASCQVHAGTWQTASTVDPTTTHTGCPATVSMSTTASTLEALVAALTGPCPAGCSCTSTPSSPPACYATVAATCAGVVSGYSAQQTTNTTLVGAIRFTFTDGSVCAYDVTGTWVSP